MRDKVGVARRVPALPPGFPSPPSCARATRLLILRCVRAGHAQAILDLERNARRQLDRGYRNAARDRVGDKLVDVLEYRRRQARRHELIVGVCVFVVGAGGGTPSWQCPATASCASVVFPPGPRPGKNGQVRVCMATGQFMAMHFSSLMVLSVANGYCVRAAALFFHFAPPRPLVQGKPRVDGKIGRVVGQWRRFAPVHPICSPRPAPPTVA